MPEIKEEFDQNITGMLKDKDVVVMCDETTNRKGDAVFITAFKILPTEANADPILVVPSVEVLTTCSGDTTSKAIIKVSYGYGFKYQSSIFINISANFDVCLAKIDN